MSAGPIGKWENLAGAHREVGKPGLAARHPTPSAPWTGARAGGSTGSVKEPLLGLEKKRRRVARDLHSQPILGCGPDVQVPSPRPQRRSPYPSLLGRVPWKGSAALPLLSAAHSQFVPPPTPGRSCLPPQPPPHPLPASLPPVSRRLHPEPSPLERRPPPPSTPLPPVPQLSRALAHASGYCSKAQSLRPSTGSGPKIPPFQNPASHNLPSRRPISNHVPSPLPQLTSSAVLIPTDTRRRRRLRIYNCSLCTRGSWRRAGWGGKSRALV